MFEPGKSAGITTAGSAVSVTSTGASDTENDVTIVASTSTDNLGSYSMSVRTPKALVNLPWVEAGGSNYKDTFSKAGKVITLNTSVKYKLLDQFGQIIRGGYHVSEKLGNDASDWPGNEWQSTHAKETSVYLAPGFSLVDDYGGSFEDSIDPVPLYPSVEVVGAATLVFHTPQSYHVGSPVIGKGVLVRTQVINQFRGYARTVEE